jgi:PIN domain
MELTYILVDFENIQPQDMGLLSGDQYQLRIFRGPHQKKLDFDIVESLQPLGDRVKYLQSDKHGKNALDFHIAFYMGRLIEELEANGSSAKNGTRFVVISHDGGFDALMGHVQSLGYPAMKAGSIRQALGLDDAVAEAGNAIPSPVSEPPNKPPAVKKAAPVAKAPPVKPATTPKKSATAQAKPSKSPEKKPQTPARTSLEPADKEKVIEHLRLHPKNRPVKRKTLQSHITSLVGGNVAAKAVRGLIADLESEGVIKFSDNKIVEYKIPEHKK